MSFQNFVQSQIGTARVGQDVLAAIQQLTGMMTPVRVTYVVLDNSDQEKFRRYGEYNGIGTIEYQVGDGESTGDKGSARPLFTNIKQYPLINEVVYLVNLPAVDNAEKLVSRPYYVTTVGLWNHPHHNAFPYDVPANLQDDYTQTTAGAVRRTTSGSTDINLGKTFQEKANIHPLQAYEGDVMVEGRWGNSIRLGSTVVDKQTNQGRSNWSEGKLYPGDPITIIRNGQDANASDQGWIPISENIQNDLTSIYLTSRQKINLDTKQQKPLFTSYNQDKPTFINEYQDSQILMTSGRIVAHSKTDHVLISSAKSINLSAIESINVDTTGYVSLSADKILLGGPEATQGVLYGDLTVKQLQKIVEILTKLATSLQQTQVTSFGSVPQLVLAGSTVKADLASIDLQSLVSPKTKVL